MNQRQTAKRMIECIMEEAPNFSRRDLTLIDRYLKWAYAVGYDNCRTMTRGKRAVLQIKDGKIIQRFESAAQAARKMKVTKASISSTARGIKKTCQGFEWKYDNK